MPLVVKTQVTDTYIDGVVHPPVDHKTEKAARAYAAEVSGRKRGAVVQVSGPDVDAVYEDGAEVAEPVTG